MHRLIDRRWPVRTILVGIAILLVLPGLLFGAVLLDRFAEAERAETRSEALATASRVADALDRELGILVVAARVLAASRALAAGDVEGFQPEAQALVGVIKQEVILADPTGHVLLDTRVPPGAPVLATDATEAWQLVVTERRPFVSDLFTGASGRPRIAVLAPVLRGGEVAYVVGLSLDPAYFTTILQMQALPAGWLASVRDDHNRLFARTQDVQRYLGRTPTQRYLAHVADDRSVWTGTTLEGTPILAAYAKTRLANWRVGVGVPLTVAEESLRTSVLALALSGVVTLTFGCGLAWLLARSVAGPLARLADAGQDLGAGREVTPVRSRIGEVDAVSRALVGASFDLHARRDALAAERAQLAAIIETVPVGLLIAEAPSGRVVAGNRQLGRMLHFAPDLQGARAEICFDGDGTPVPPDQTPLSRALAGEDPAELRCRYRRADRSLFWVQAVAAPIRAGNGTATGAVVALLDIDEVVRAREQKARWAERLEEEVASRTAELERANDQLRDEISARSRAEDQLRQSQKMEAVGRLTGGIAHDFNNLLTVIVGSLDLLRRRVTEPRTLHLIDNAMDGANRAASLTARLLAFSRRQPLVPQPVDVNGLVAGMSDLLHRTLGETIQVETVLGDAVGPALADPNQLENALLNLAVNARDAILDASQGGGRLVIATANASIDERCAAQSADAEPGEYLVIATTDTGTGMSAETLSRAFEPFFTTKPSGQGTGLGLSQVHGFAKQSGGHAAIESAPGRGTTVRLFLPRLHQDAKLPAASTPSHDDPPSRNGETILIVEDEAGVRRFTGEALRELGYVVLEAESAEQALVVLEHHPETALLMTDVIMAGMGGHELAERVQRQCPKLRVLLTSGYSGVRERRDLGGRELLAKPFTVSALARKVGEILLSRT